MEGRVGMSEEGLTGLREIISKNKPVALVVGLVFVLAITVNLYSVFFGVYPVVTGGELDDYSKYVKVYYVGQHMYPITVKGVSIDGERGEFTVPIEGTVNVFLPQYVRCPDICHYETNIIRYVMVKLDKEGLLDKVVFVTIDVDPWKGTEDEALQYMRENVEPLGIQPRWIWVGSDTDIEKLKNLWIQLGITVQRDPETGLIQHTGGFYIVSEKGFYLYYVGPTPDGWKAQDKVAEALYMVLKAVIQGERIEPGNPLAKAIIEGRP